MTEESEFEKKWHKLIKILYKKDIIDWDEREGLELDSYIERKVEEWWNS